MNKLLYKVLFTITTIFTFSNSTMVISMDHTINKSDKNLRIPHKKELVNELDSFCRNIQAYVKKYTDKENKSDNEYDLETQMAANAAKKEFELDGKTGKQCGWGVCPDYMQNTKIALNDYIEKMSKVYDEGKEGVCRHVASSLFKKLSSKGFFCGIMFCWSGNPSSIGSMRIPGPNHVVTLIASQDSDEIQFFVSDPRLLQVALCNNYRYMQNPKKIQNHSNSVWYNPNKPDEFLKKISKPIDVLLIPLDKYLEFKDIHKDTISVAFELNSKLNFSKDGGFMCRRNTNIGNKKVDDFKEQAEIFFKSTIGGIK